MPIYEFKCSSCYHLFEELCSIGTVIIKCPICSSLETKRQISSFGIGGGKGQSEKFSSTSKCNSCHSGHCHGCH